MGSGKIHTPSPSLPAPAPTGRGAYHGAVFHFLLPGGSWSFPRAQWLQLQVGIVSLCHLGWAGRVALGRDPRATPPCPASGLIPPASLPSPLWVPQPPSPASSATPCPALGRSTQKTPPPCAAPSREGTDLWAMHLSHLGSSQNLHQQKGLSSPQQPPCPSSATPAPSSFMAFRYLPGALDWLWMLST